MHWAEVSPRPSWPVDSDAEAFKGSVHSVRFDIDDQTRASNDLLWTMENKMAEEAVLMDEIDVLLRVMRDNLTPSYMTSETQASSWLCLTGFHKFRWKYDYFE